ncbi:hypothetical protein ABW19_dt0200764 [Dactylella cylindrospora]|nr:hypothetical protein ABW19_dt0200764 [Dactylella cylindrospora]
MASTTTSSFPAFTPIHSLAGGLMLASSVIGLLRLTGKVLGISGFIHTTVKNLIGRSPKSNDIKEKTSRTIAAALTGGLIVGGFILRSLRTKLEGNLGIQLFDDVQADSTSRTLLFALSGIAVGLGTKLGSGCTSGHFLCGLSRLSPRSIVATATFFSISVITHLATTSAELPVTAHPSSLPTATALLLLQLPFIMYGVVVPLLARNVSDPERKAAIFDYAAAATAFSIGVHFTFGLGLSGMLRPSKVLGFLSLSPTRISNGSWDPSLAMIAIGGILPAAAHWFLRAKPKIEAAKVDTSEENQPTLVPNCGWSVPTSKQITSRLVVGAGIFGIGWGLTGLCPGPVLANFGASTDVKNIGISLGTIALGGLLGDAF